MLNLPLQRTVAQFDLKPERDTQLELGGHIPVGSGDLGFRVWQKNANDFIDDTQVGVTLLHQDINYVLGRLSQEALNYVQPLSLNSRAYFTIAHVVSLNSGCETQLLAPCFGQPTGFTPADHEQRYTITSGILLNDRRGGWFSADAYYGSGLSSAFCPLDTPGYCKETPHTIFNVEDGIALSPKTALTLDIQNLLNDRYYVTLLNAQGNHFGPGRELNIGRHVPASTKDPAQSPGDNGPSQRCTTSITEESSSPAARALSAAPSFGLSIGAAWRTSSWSIVWTPRKNGGTWSHCASPIASMPTISPLGWRMADR